jgi:hypothetical protein
MSRLAARFRCALLLICACAAQCATLGNQVIRLELGATSKGVPAITKAAWTASGATLFAEDGSGDGFSAWVPTDLAPGAKRGRVKWMVTEDAVFHRATSSILLAGGTRVTWVVELARESQLLRLRVEMKNESAAPRAIEWFPAWTANWRIPAGSRWLRSWDSLSFRQMERPWPVDGSMALASRLHSSEEKGRIRIGWWAAAPTVSISGWSGAAVGKPRWRVARTACSSAYGCRRRKRSWCCGAARVSPGPP